MRAKTVHDVIEKIDMIIDRTRKEKSRIGYFAALYHHVAVRFEQKLNENYFVHSDEIANLDVIFFNRYLEAIDNYWNGQLATSAWNVTFEAAKSKCPIVLQHLLLGMNAHIGLDLGVAVARSVPADRLLDFKDDFDKMNDLLASLFDTVKCDLAKIWPTLRLVDALLGNIENEIVNFSMAAVRRRAWNIAIELSRMTPQEQFTRIDEIDREIAFLSRLIWKPGIFTRIGIQFIRMGERGTVPQIIDTLLSSTCSQ